MKPWIDFGMAKPWLPHLLIPVVGGLAVAEPLSAQAVGAILGQVLEDVADAPVPGAAIEVLDARGQVVRRTIADSSGQFIALITRASAYRLRATRIGHAESLSAPIEVRLGDTLHVILRMDVEAIALPVLEVVSRSRNAYPARLEGFEYRLERGFGTFIRREDIVRRAPRQVSDLLQEYGVTVEQRGGHQTEVGLLSRRYNCAPLVYIDGVVAVPLYRDASHEYSILEAGRAVNMIHPLDIEGIEVHQGGATVPPEFGGSYARCGVVVIWTRVGG